MEKLKMKDINNKETLNLFSYANDLDNVNYGGILLVNGNNVIIDIKLNFSRIMDIREILSYIMEVNIKPILKDNPNMNLNIFILGEYEIYANLGNFSFNIIGYDTTRCDANIKNYRLINVVDTLIVEKILIVNPLSLEKIPVEISNKTNIYLQTMLSILFKL